MEDTSSSVESNYSYSTSTWNTTALTAPSSHQANAANAAADGSSEGAAAVTGTFPSHLEFLPFYYPQQSNIYQAQLLHYNKLVSPSRGGGGLQGPALPPIVSAPFVQAAPRSRSSSKASLKESTPAKRNGHGNRSHPGDKAKLHVTGKEAATTTTTTNMPTKKSPEALKNLSLRPLNASSASSASQNPPHSSSVPSTPRQHARQFSFESREPSPSANVGHSPRSVYSESNSTLPSLRPLPPRNGGCKYETAQYKTRRRIPYSTGNDRLEKLDIRTVKEKLSDDEERKLATDMREIYDRLLPTDAVEEKRKKLVAKLETIFNDEWPGHNITVHLFGSSGNLLCSDDSDGESRSFAGGYVVQRANTAQWISASPPSGRRWRGFVRSRSY